MVSDMNVGRMFSEYMEAVVYRIKLNTRWYIKVVIDFQNGDTKIVKCFSSRKMMRCNHISIADDYKLVSDNVLLQVNEYEKTGCSVYLIHKLELHTKKLEKLVYII